jgi:hypothetical protein
MSVQTGSVARIGRAEQQFLVLALRDLAFEVGEEGRVGPPHQNYQAQSAVHACQSPLSGFGCGQRLGQKVQIGNG